MPNSRQPGGKAVRCTARSKRTGQQCKAWATPGATVCRAHGGAAGQVRAAAKRRVEKARAVAEAAADLTRLGIAIETTPVEALEQMLWKAAGTVAVLESMVADLDLHSLYSDLFHANGSPTGRALPHVLVVMLNDERDRYARLAEACAKLGLDERRVQLAEAQVAKLFDHVTGAIADCGLNAEQTARFKQSLAARIRGV